ncbi:MFS transporter [Arachidicoccus terrestris]|uniref:MFS transporter n=1 Tax=Arachidicoccus terrestris TaxID=2875539 RepID=UPI001CC3B5EE|nr:MFS transporter [Arachidicoccus terrestris]UAY55377.1 MFS transporter [Arachidicoccus terrestris]
MTKNSLLLALTSLFSDISTEMLYPVLPIFLTQTLKTGGGIVGIIEGMAITTQNLVQGFSGWLSDKWQKHKKIAICGYLLAAISKPLTGLATGWPTVGGARFMDRLGSGIRSAPRDALIASSTDEKNRGKAFGLEGAGDNLGAFIGPLVAVFVIFILGFSLRSVFFLSVIPGTIAVLMILFVKEKKVPISSKTKLDFKFRQFTLNYKKYLVVTALFSLGNSSNAFLILQSRDLGISFRDTIIIYAVFNLIAALISYPAGHISDKIGRKNMLLLSLLTYIMTYVGFALTKNLWAIGSLFCLYGLYQGIFRSVGKALAADFVPQHLKASGIGWYAATIGLSGLIASNVAGQLWDRVSHEAVFLYGALFACMGFFAFIFFVQSDRK